MCENNIGFYCRLKIRSPVADVIHSVAFLLVLIYNRTLRIAEGFLPAYQQVPWRRFSNVTVMRIRGRSSMALAGDAFMKWVWDRGSTIVVGVWSVGVHTV